MGENLGPFLRHVDRTVKVPLTNQEIVDRTEKMTALHAEQAAADARFEEAKAMHKAQKLRIERELAPVIREIGEKKAPRVQRVSVHRHPNRHDFVLEVYDGEVIAEREIEKADTQLRLSGYEDPPAAAVPPITPDAAPDAEEEDDGGEFPWGAVDDDEELDEVIEAGRAARRDGVPLDDNPYREDDDEHTRWARGWGEENPIALFAEGAAARENGEDDDESRPEEWRRGWAVATPHEPERERVDLKAAILGMSPAALDAYLVGLERAELFDVYHRICGRSPEKGKQSKTLIAQIKSAIDKHNAER